MKGKNWTATVHLGVVDASTAAGVEGVTVSLTYESTSTASLAAKPGTPGGGGGGGTGSGALSCVTDTAGRCSVSTSPTGDAVRFTVTGMVKDGWVHDPARDVDADTSTDATDIAVSRSDV